MVDITYALASSGVYGLQNGAYADSLGLPVTIEDFEESSPLNDYRGDTAEFSITTSTVKEGSQALARTTSSSANGDAAILYDGTGDTIETDATYKYWVRWTVDGQNHRPYLIFFADSSDSGASDLDCYAIELHGGTSRAGEAIYIDEYSGGSRTNLDNTSVAITNNTWYEVAFSVDTGTSPNTIKAEITDDSSTKSVSAQDDTYTSGDHGFGADDDEFGEQDVFFDDLRKTANSPLA